MARPTQITIPALVDVDSEYADLVAREGAINTAIAEIRSKSSQVEAAITADRERGVPRLRAPIAELVGDADSAATDRRAELRDLRHAESDHTEALSILQRRRYDRRSVASRAVIAAVQSEINKRVGAVVAATQAALAAQGDLEALIRDIEAESVETDSLRSGVVPFFLTSGAAERYVAEHKGGANG